jgi:hypothetical protein
VVYHAGLLHHHAAAKENNKGWYCLNLETRRKLRVFFCIHFQHQSLARHVRSSSCDLRSSGMAWPAPLRPEVNEYGNHDVLNHFIEQRIVNCKRFREGRQR